MPPRQTGKGFPGRTPGRGQGDKRPVQGLQTHRSDARATRPEQPPQATLPSPGAMVSRRHGGLYRTQKTRTNLAPWRCSQPDWSRQTRSRNSPEARVKSMDKSPQSISMQYICTIASALVPPASEPRLSPGPPGNAAGPSISDHLGCPPEPARLGPRPSIDHLDP